MANRENAILPPRPLAATLPKAISAFIAAKWPDRSRMIVPAWAQTYRCGVETVRAEWERQKSITSQSPDNAGEIPEGK